VFDAVWYNQSGSKMEIVMVSIRAIYHNGQLRLLDPIDLQEGEEVNVQITKPTTALLVAIADMLMPVEDNNVDDQWDDEHHQATLDKALEGHRPLSEIILEERYEDA
jgi:predicted DNA-binding antitoxin AbrB/MazE fold protein